MSRFKTSKPYLKRAARQSFHPRELIIPSAKQEQMWAEGIYAFVTKKPPRRSN